MPRGRKKVDVASVDGALAPYARASVGPLLEAAFGKTEQLSGRDNNDLPNVGRGDCLIIDGKTPREIMLERYLSNPANRVSPLDGKPVSFDRFYANHYSKKLVSELVTGALMAGKRVEAFIPDKSGKIPDEPTRITKSGYEPSPQKRVTLNAWERFWSKRGFYKEKAARAAEAQRFADARERVRAYNDRGHTAMLNTRIGAAFNGVWEAKNGPLPAYTPHHFTTGRGAFRTMTTLVMLNQGHSLEDIYDPDKLQAERYAAMQQVHEHTIKNPDFGWEAKQFVQGGERWISEVNRFAKTCDLGNPNAPLTEERKLLTIIGISCYDYFQEKSHLIQAADEDNAAHPWPEGRIEALRATLDNYGQKLTNLRTVCMGIQSMTNAAAELSLGDPQGTMHALNGVISAAFCADTFSADVRAHPETNILDINTGETYEMRLTAPNALLGMSGTPESQALANAINARGSAHDAIRGMAARGELGRHMNVSVDLQKFKIGVQLDNTLKKAAGLEQSAARKQNAPPVKKAPVKQAPARTVSGP